MLAVQIQQGNDSYYRPLEARPLVVGSGGKADLKLDDPALALEHFRLVVDSTNDRSCRLEVLSGAEPVRVNGTATTGVVLHLGDRIDAGRISIVLGQQLRRPATASDVLEDRTRRVKPPAGQRSTARLVAALVFVIGLAGAAAIGWWSTQQVRMSDEDADAIRRARVDGKFDKAASIIARLRNDWVKDDPRKEGLLVEAERAVDDTSSAYSRLFEETFDSVLGRDRYDALDAAKKRIKSGATRAEREAAALVCARFTESWLAAEERERARRRAERLAAGQPEPANAATSRPEPEPRADPTPAPAMVVAAPEWLEEQLESVRKLSREGQHQRAVETVRQILAEVPPTHAGRVRDLYGVVRDATREEMRQLVEQADAEEQRGRKTAALQLLRSNASRFPTTGDLSDLYHRLRQLEADLVTPLPAVAAAASMKPGERPVMTKADRDKLAGLMDLVAQTERSGDLDLSIERLMAAAHDARALPEMAAELQGRLDDSMYVVRLSEDLRGRVRAASQIELELPGGEKVVWCGMDGHRLLVAGENGRRSVPLADVPVHSLAVALERAHVGGSSRLGLAVLGYRSGEKVLAENQLALYLRERNSPLRRRTVDAVIRRGRGDPPGGAGYVLERGRFVAVEAQKTEQETRQFLTRLSAQVGKPVAARDKLFEECRDANEAATRGALLSLRDDLVTKIKSNTIRKRIDRLLESRKGLDAARQTALELIFDLDKYFYPFKPPAVSGARHAEYNEVQAEVDRRVAAVRKIWNEKQRLAVPKAILQQLEMLAWVDRQLGVVGAGAPGVDPDLDWARSLPQETSLTIRNVCTSVAERHHHDMWQRIETWNDQQLQKVSAAEREQMTLTNDYRTMMGRAPLAIHPAVVKAAQGHAKEMGERGYFSHFSPVPERRTPLQRMQLAGYHAGVSENIAATPTAASAHDRWLHSSGHHRNILGPAHTEFGVGSTGSLWVQNYGRGDDVIHRDDFPKAAAAR